MAKRHQINTSKYLNSREIFELKANLSFRECRDSILIRVLMESGARSAELINISVHDLSLEDIDDASVLILGLKGSNDRTLSLTRETASLLVNYLKANDITSGKAFRCTTRTVRNAWAKFKPVDSRLGVHALRHTFAVEAYKKTSSVLLVKSALGHVDLRSTMVYVDHVNSLADLVKLKGVI